MYIYIYIYMCKVTSAVSVYCYLIYIFSMHFLCRTNYIYNLFISPNIFLNTHLLPPYKYYQRCVRRWNLACARAPAPPVLKVHRWRSGAALHTFFCLSHSAPSRRYFMNSRRLRWFLMCGNGAICGIPAHLWVSCMEHWRAKVHTAV